jgi:hypothetical protein
MKMKIQICLLVLVILAGGTFAGILLYTGQKAETKFTVIHAPKPGEEISTVKMAGAGEEEKINYAEMKLGTNLALSKRIVADNFTQDYIAENTTDGNVKTYWEGTPDFYPNFLTVDLGASARVKCIRIKLNPNNIWEKRTQTLSVYGSLDDKEYSKLVDTNGYVFDPETGNCVIVNFTAANVRYVRLEFSANTAARAGQAAEFEVY